MRRPMLEPPTLVLTDRRQDDDQRLWRAAVRRGWSVVRVRGIQFNRWPIQSVSQRPAAVYVEPLFAHAVAEKLDARLLDPSPGFLADLPRRHVHREIVLTKLSEARRCDRPRFVKPPNDKSFVARVYERGDDLPDDLPGDTPVLSADVVAFDVEHRMFMLDGLVVTSSPYRRFDELSERHEFFAPDDEAAAAQRFAESVVNDPSVEGLPSAVVLDVGRLEGGPNDTGPSDDERWAVVEANGAWGSGLYGCDADAALDVIARCVVRRTE